MKNNLQGRIICDFQFRPTVTLLSTTSSPYAQLTLFQWDIKMDLGIYTPYKQVLKM